MKNAVILLCIALIASSGIAVSFGSDELTLRKLEREHALASYMGDVGWFRAHVADDYVLVTGSGAITTKEKIVEQLSRGVTMDPYEPTDVQIHAYGSTAVVTGRILRRYPEGGERVIADLRYMGVWIKTEEGWINISGQESPISIKRERLK